MHFYILKDLSCMNSAFRYPNDVINHAHRNLRDLELSPEFWSWKFWSPRPKFSVEKWSPKTHFFGKNGLCLEIWSWLSNLERQSVVHLIRVSLFLVYYSYISTHLCSCLEPFSAWLGSSPGTVLGVSASAPIKAHHQFFARKTSHLRPYFSFVVTYLGCLMLLTTCSTELYPFHKRQ